MQFKKKKIGKKCDNVKMAGKAAASTSNAIQKKKMGKKCDNVKVAGKGEASTSSTTITSIKFEIEKTNHQLKVYPKRKRKLCYYGQDEDLGDADPKKGKRNKKFSSDNIGFSEEEVVCVPICKENETATKATLNLEMDNKMIRGKENETVPKTTLNAEIDSKIIGDGISEFCRQNYPDIVLAELWLRENEATSLSESPIRPIVLSVVDNAVIDEGTRRK